MVADIYLLRHCDRLEGTGFYTNLTDKGSKESINLVDKLINYRFDSIFSSPYLRTLLSIRPFCEKLDKKVQLEYSLCSRIKQKNFNESSYKTVLKDVTNFNNILDSKYNSYLRIDDLEYNENKNFLNKRVIKFIEFLNIKYSGEKILLVTHNSVIKAIRNTYLDIQAINYIE
tara:strand:- start:126 stop:641 length:516 start_codon:yes stop_codon:yes gene_type:complete